MEFQSLHGKISDYASRMPGKVAIECGSRKITYQELEVKTNQIGNFFYFRLTEPKNVAIFLENSIEFVQSLLGLLKSGSIFVPLDPGFPDNRLKMMLDEADVDWIISCNEHLGRLEQIMEGRKRKVLILDDYTPADFNHIEVFTLAGSSETECAFSTEIFNKHCYIYFTSGSTGKAKAILGRHRSLKHFIDWEIKEFKIDASFKISQLITPTFDAVLRDIFVPLCVGATLCIPAKRELILDPKTLKDWIDEQQINLIHTVPALFKALISEIEDSNCLHSLQYILLAGEILRGNDVKKFFELFGERIQLVNLYGATETTLVKLFYRVKPTDFDKISIPVGKPMEGAQVMILDHDLKSCQLESIGEIYIRTPFISSGYYNDKELTRKVFLPNPFSNNSQDIIYKTGDLGRMLPSGDVEILGRVDHQVKIRGVRIELGEIEKQLLDFPGVKEAVVAIKEEETGGKYLAAYVVSTVALSINELREFISKELPDYMVPTYFIQLTQMPLTSSGKIDRKSLPLPDINLETAEFMAAQDEIEEKLLTIWSEVLGVKHLGINHNFFDLGGHSLKAATVIARVHKELDVEVPLREIFLNPTIKKLATYIKKIEKNIYTSIRPIEVQEYYPVSSAQRRLYILNRLAGMNNSYNVSRAVLMEGILDKQRLEKIFRDLINRQDSLRTSFSVIEGEILQKVHQEVDFEISCFDAHEGELPQIISQFIRPFDLETAPLLRVGLVKLAEDRHIMLFDMHHIVADGMSIGILVKDFLRLYRGEVCQPLLIQYKDFATWQNNLLKTPAMDSQEKFWLNTFSGEIPVLNLPTDYIRPTVQNFTGSNLNCEADSELLAKLNTLARTTNTTLYMILLAAYNVLLHKYSNQDDIIVGSPIAGRPHVDLHGIIGMFVNTLAMRNYPKGSKTFRKFLQEVKENALFAYENQDYQFESLVEKLNLPRNLSRNPLFDTMLILQNTDLEELEIQGLKLIPYEIVENTTKFDLVLNADEIDGKLNIRFSYSTKLFKRETIARLSSHYLNILQQLSDNVELKITDIEILSAEEKERLLVDFNQTTTDYAKNSTLHELFTEQVAKTPNNLALCFADQKLTYAEFNARSNQLARNLRAKGVKSEKIVAIMVQRSPEILIGILAILKAGGAYLPIDPEYPAERVKFMLTDSDTQIILTQKKFLPSLSALSLDIFDLDENVSSDSANLESVSKPENLAYVIYTSGSSGKPKGVMIEHRAVTNFITGMTRRIDFSLGKSILALTTISFDIFVLETIVPLTKGLKVIIATEEEQRDPRALARVITNYQIEMLQMTPSRLRMLLNDDRSFICLENVQEIMIGGEAFPETLLAELREVTNARIYNMYGPTETTVWSTVQDLTFAEEINIGQPIANTKIYLVDQDNQLKPIGIPGELCIAGEGLARGYLHRPELTAEKFVPNPFVDSMYTNEKRMYRTGDLARWLPDGNIEFMGRIDHQLKIRGHRIEPGEIERELLKHAAIKEALIIAKDDASGVKYLCAYLVGERKLSSTELWEHLSKELPDYMLPAFFLQLDSIPLTPNGKIDRKALPDPEGNITKSLEFIAPATEVEQKLAIIWQQVLGIENIGINHNFFEIGGNSVNILKVISLINQEFGIDLSLSTMFLKPTIKAIAENLYTGNLLNSLECVVSMNNPDVKKPNLFIIHGRDGDVYAYKELARFLDTECNFYGIQARGLTRPGALPDSVDEMITEYIYEMKAVQPYGPYFIGGYCYGSRLVYEMARRLEENGEVVEKLLIIDEWAFMPEIYLQIIKARMYTTRPFKKLRDVLHKTHSEKDSLEFWSEAYHSIKTKQKPASLQNAESIRQNLAYLCEHPLKYPLRNFISAPTYVLKAKESTHSRFNAEDWGKMTYGKVTFYEIAGDHHSIFAYPHVEELANAVKQVLRD